MWPYQLTIMVNSNKVINNTDKTKQEIENNIFYVGYEVGTKSLGETVKTECRLGREN